jgi:hypothetical protein
MMHKPSEPRCTFIDAGISDGETYIVCTARKLDGHVIIDSIKQVKSSQVWSNK